MFDETKLDQWLSLQETVDRHAETAHAALVAIDTKKDRLVNRHLLRIARREGDLADFLLHVSESKAFDIFREEE